jgi:hypothetical protein
MSSQPARQNSGPQADDQFVVEYLKQDPEFFERHPGALAQLRLPHARGTTAVTLVERQIEVLRERAQLADRRLAEFVGVARANEQLADKIHRFARRLMRASTVVAALNEIDNSLREDFDAFNSRLVLVGLSVETQSLTNLHFARTTTADDPMLKSFEHLFASGKPRCGQVRDTQREWLFGTDAESVGSTALVPLGTHGALGLLALASPDRDRFHPGMATEFLGRMADFIHDALTRTPGS